MTYLNYCRRLLHYKKTSTWHSDNLIRARGRRPATIISYVMHLYFITEQEESCGARTGDLIWVCTK